MNKKYKDYQAKFSHDGVDIDISYIYTEFRRGNYSLIKLKQNFLETVPNMLAKKKNLEYKNEINEKKWNEWFNSIDHQ